MRSLASRTLVVLAAALVPLQPLSAAGCYCGTVSRHETGVEKQAGSDREKACCCKKALRVPGNTCCGSAVECSCSSDESSHSEPQNLPQRHSQTVQDLGQPADVLSLSRSEFQVAPSLPSADWRPFASGLERCIVLCRFNL